MEALDIMQADQRTTMYREGYMIDLIDWDSDGFIYVETGREYPVSKQDLFADDWKINRPAKLVKKWKWAIRWKYVDKITEDIYTEKEADTPCEDAVKLPWTQIEVEEC